MELSGFVDVGLALVTVYLLISLLASTINEIINTVLKTRAKKLAATIQSILDSDELRTAFFDHGLIGGTGRSSTAGKVADPPKNDTGTTPPGGAEQQPAAVDDDAEPAPPTPPAAKDQPAVDAAQQADPAIVETPANPALQATDGASKDDGATKQEAEAEQAKLKASYIDSKTFADALLGSLAKLSAGHGTVPVLSDIETAIKNLAPGVAKDSLLSVLAMAKDDITTFRDGVAAWFDSSMDRLSGDFVRYMKYVSFGVGFVLALALNVDSINIAMRAWNEKEVREAVVAVATKLQEQELTTCSSEGAQPPDPSGDGTTTDLAADVPATPAEIECQAEQATNLLDLLSPLPVGWGAGAVPWWNDAFPEKGKEAGELDTPPLADAAAVTPAPTDSVTSAVTTADGAKPAAPVSEAKSTDKGTKKPVNGWTIFCWLCFKALGLVITGVAVSLGAPFWFDILQKVMNVRMAGTKPTETNK